MHRQIGMIIMSTRDRCHRLVTFDWLFDILKPLIVSVETETGIIGSIIKTDGRSTAARLTDEFCWGVDSGLAAPSQANHHHCALSLIHI